MEPLEEQTSSGAPGVSDAVTDTLIFHIDRDLLRLVGGTGRGEGWTGIVDLPLTDEQRIAGVHRSGLIARIDSVTDAIRVVGPYWGHHAVLVPVGGEHVVVFGGARPIPDPDSSLRPVAALLVADVQQVTPSKLLADELEVVHAIRNLMQLRPTGLEEAARHIAGSFAEPLSCEVGAVLVRHRARLVAEVVTLDWPKRLDPAAIRTTLIDLFERAEQGPFLDLELDAQADDALGRSAGLVSRFTLPLGYPTPFGVVVVAHAATKPRGFTNLCQRIGRALAEAAESVLLQAMSREELTAERDSFAREARIDPVTGLENRTSWEECLRVEETRLDRYQRATTIVSADLDRLKETNDSGGHDDGDRLLKAAADVFRSCARASDRLARVGGDEFLILLPETGVEGATIYLARVRAALRRKQKRTGQALEVSIGAATARAGESLSAVAERADARMYAVKRRRARRDPESSQEKPSQGPPPG